DDGDAVVEMRRVRTVEEVLPKERIVGGQHGLRARDDHVRASARVDVEVDESLPVALVKVVEPSANDADREELRGWLDDSGPHWMEGLLADLEAMSPDGVVGPAHGDDDVLGHRRDAGPVERKQERRRATRVRDARVELRGHSGSVRKEAGQPGLEGLEEQI